MGVSIIVASINRHRELTRLLNSLTVFTNEPFEVIIVDQSKSLFKPSKKYKFPIIILSHSPGASASRNFGALYAHYETFWFLDDDCHVAPNSILSNLKVESLKFIQWAERPKPKFLIKFSKFSYLAKNIFIIRSSGAPFFMISKSLFEEIGGFDEEIGPGTRIRAGEDLDLCLRAIFAAVKYECFEIDFDDKIIIHHRLESLVGDKKLGYIMSRAFIYKKLNIKHLILLEFIFAMITLDFGKLKILWRYK